MPLPFSFRSSWPDQRGDPNLPRARRTLMKTTEADACPADVPLTPNTPTWISKTFSTCLFKARQFGFCSNSHPLAVQLCGSRVYGWHCLLFMFLVPNKRHLLSYVCVSGIVLKHRIQFIFLVSAKNMFSYVEATVMMHELVYFLEQAYLQSRYFLFYLNHIRLL